MTDIVDVLRTALQPRRNRWHIPCNRPCIERYEAAADEIDRLRSKNKELETLLRQWQDPEIEVRMHLYDPTQPSGDS